MAYPSYMYNPVQYNVFQTYYNQQPMVGPMQQQQPMFGGPVQQQQPMYPYPQQPQANPNGEGLAQYMGFMQSFMGMLMPLLATIGLSNRQIPPTREVPMAEEPVLDPNDPDSLETSPEDLVNGEDPSDAQGAFRILSAYSDYLGYQDNGISRSELRKITLNTKLPENVREAAQTLYDNKALHNLLSLQSEQDPKDGFNVDALAQFEDAENLGDLEDMDADEAKQIFNENWNKLSDISKNADGSRDKMVTKEELMAVALGTSTSRDCQDPKLRSAVLKVLSDPALRAEIAEERKGTGTALDKGIKFWGDPHLVGEDGETYDVMGEPGKVYNMLSDKHIQYNAKFEKWGHVKDGDTDMTVVDQAGIKVGNNEVSFDRSGNAPTINGKAMATNQEYDLGNGTKAKWDGTKLVIDTPEYELDLQVKKGTENGKESTYIDSNVKAKVDQDGQYLVGRDGVMPHGLLGQTIDNDTDKKNNGKNLGKQGGSVIDGTYTDYEVKDGLFGFDFVYNRYEEGAEYDPGDNFFGS